MQLYRPNPILEFIRKYKYNIILLSVCGVCLITAGTILTVWIVGIDVPDLKTASPEQIGEFIKSDDFLDMPSAKRREFVDGVVNKHMQMSPEERAAAFKKFSKLNLRKKENRKKMQKFFMDWGIQRANEYAKLPDDKKVQYVDNLLNMAMLMGGGRRPDANQRRQMRRNRGRNANRPPNVSRMMKGMAEMNRNTTARERANVTNLMGDVIARARYRFER